MAIIRRVMWIVAAIIIVGATVGDYLGPVDREPDIYPLENRK